MNALHSLKPRECKNVLPEMMNRNNNIYCRFTSTIANGGNHPPECKCYSRIVSSYDQSLEELKFQKSACHFAQIGNVEKLKQLLEKDASDGQTPSTQLSGLTPLHYASGTATRSAWSYCWRKVQVRGNADDIGELDGVDASECNWGGWNSRDVVESRGGPSLRDDDGETALHKAYTFIRREKRRCEFWGERRKRAEMKFEKIVKALVMNYQKRRRWR